MQAKSTTRKTLPHYARRVLQALERRPFRVSSGSAGINKLRDFDTLTTTTSPFCNFEAARFDWLAQSAGTEQSAGIPYALYFILRPPPPPSGNIYIHDCAMYCNGDEQRSRRACLKQRDRPKIRSSCFRWFSVVTRAIIIKTVVFGDCDRSTIRSSCFRWFTAHPRH